MQCDPPVEAMEASSDALSNAVSDNRGTVPIASNVALSVATASSVEPTASSVPGARAVANVPGGAGGKVGQGRMKGVKGGGEGGTKIAGGGVGGQVEAGQGRGGADGGEGEARGRPLGRGWSNGNE